jgi:hypothetical protein
MRHALIMLLAALSLPALAQTASTAEAELVQQLAPCLVQGVPGNWERIYMVMELPEAGAPSGRVRYLVTRDSAPDPAPYTPCDRQKPAQLLMDSRKDQSPERRGWTGARLTIHRNGRFDLNYDYPR